jgi:site-specific recombinase XerD
MPRLDARLRRRGIVRLEDLCAAELLRFAPRRSQDDVQLSSVVRSLARYLDGRGLLARRALTSSEQVVAAYRIHLERVRGLAQKTQKLHSTTAAALLAFLDFDQDPVRLRDLGSKEIEAFVRAAAARLCRESLQHAVAYLRSFLRFLASRNEVTRGLDATIDTPRLYRGERLPRALAWQSVQSFLDAIDRSTPRGQRDHAMFLLIATYGLRTSEVAALRLDDIKWRTGRIRVPRPKTKTLLELPLTDEVGAVLINYLRNVRPDVPCREVFVRVRAPAGPIGPTAVSEAFRTWTRRGALPTPCQGPHCLRHSLAVHLLRQGTSLKAIGDLLGHRSAESTCVYLRLHVEDLRDAALALPQEVLA